MVRPIDSGSIYPYKKEIPPCTHDETCPRDAKEMPGHRHRTLTGKLRQKRGNTSLDSLEKQYGEISARPGQTTLKELRQITGEEGINKVHSKLKEMESVEIPEKRFIDKAKKLKD